MVHTVRDFLVFVRQGTPNIEPLRLHNIDEGEVTVDLYTPTDAAMARLAIDHAGEVPEDALVVQIIEDDYHPMKVAYAPMMEFPAPERTPDGWKVHLLHPPTETLTELTVRDLRGRDIRYAATLGLEHPEEVAIAALAARTGLDYPSYQRIAFVDHLALSRGSRFLLSTMPTG